MCQFTQILFGLLGGTFQGNEADSPEVGRIVWSGSVCHNIVLDVSNGSWREYLKHVGKVGTRLEEAALAINQKSVKI